MNIDLIRIAPVFTGLSDTEREILGAGFTGSKCAANAPLFKAGEQSDALYLIEQGFVRLTTNSGQNLATLGPGSVLGEASLFRATVQDVSAVAVADLELWKLPDRKLREIILHNPFVGLKLSQNFGSLIAQMEDYLVHRLFRTTELNGLPHHTLQALASYLTPRTLRAQDPLFRAGDVSAGLFILESGAVELRPEYNVADQDVQRMQPGAIIGALSLLTNKPYTMSAVAQEDSLFWWLSTESFQTVNSRHPGLRRSLGRNVRARLGKGDQAQAVRRLAQMPIFAEAPPPTMQAIAQRMEVQHVPAGERVYRVGEAGDALYLIESGEIELTEENASGVVEEKARIGDAGFFGEMSLLTGQIRTEDATATRNTNLWILAKSDLDELTNQHPALARVLSQGIATRLSGSGVETKDEHFRKFALLTDLNPSDLRQVLERLRPTRFRAGEQIYRVNTPADTLYLLEKGQVRVQPLSGLTWSLGAGETFGERALLSNQPHNTSVVAETDVDVWTLNKQDFEMLMARYPSLAINLSRMLSQRMVQTTGDILPPEYEEPAIAPVRRRQSAGAYNNPEAPGRRGGVGQWYANLTGWGKLRFALLILLILFFLGITVPFVLIALVSGTREATHTVSRALASIYNMGSYEVAVADQNTARALAMVERQAPPTPTYTPPPTNTPIPTPTFIPTAAPNQEPASAPIFIPASAAQQQQPLAQEAPPPPAEPDVQAASVAVRAWDSRLDQLGVTIEEAQVSPGQQYWRLIEGRWADEAESAGKHHIYVEALDESGNRIVGQPVTVWWGDGFNSGPIEDKPAPDFGYNFQMYASGFAYNTKIEGMPSDVVNGAGMGSIDQRFYGIHTSFYFVFQRATK